MLNNNAQSELKILRELVQQLQDPAEAERKHKRLRHILLSVGYTGLVIGFLLIWHSIIHVVISSLIVAMAGAAVGMGVFLGWLIKQWPITSRYVDMDRVKQRLTELES